MMYQSFEQDEEAHDTRRELKQFVDDFQLYIFISICQMDYVGTDTADTTFYVQEVCNEISLLRHIWKDGKVRTFTDTPEYLSLKKFNNSVSLPDNATGWPLQLPPTYLSALEDKLRHRVTSADNFHMPYLIILHKKSNHLQVLREFFNAAVNFSRRWRKILNIGDNCCNFDNPGTTEQKAHHLWLIHNRMHIMEIFWSLCSSTISNRN